MSPLKEKSGRPSLIRAGVNLTAPNATGLPRSLVNALRLEQVFVNLGQNAIHAMDRGGHLLIRTRPAPARPSFVVSRSHQDAALEQFLAAAPPHEAVSRGSSLKFCQVAEGTADLYPRTGPTSEWDTAAGQCVAEQAGAQVLQLPGRARLRYNQKDALLNPRFAVVGDSTRDWSTLLDTIA